MTHGQSIIFHYPNKEYNFKKKFNLSLLIKNKINYLNEKKFL